MSSVIKTGNTTHDTTCNTALGTLQAAVAAATTQAAVRTASITYYQACLASAIANKCGSETFRTALRALGAGSV
jgi:hypothetical protein